jgi:hypothetical protein
VCALAGDLDLRIALERLLDQDPQLQSRERGAQAEVPEQLQRRPLLEMGAVSDAKLV